MNLERSLTYYGLDNVIWDIAFPSCQGEGSDILTGTTSSFFRSVVQSRVSPWSLHCVFICTGHPSQSLVLIKLLKYLHENTQHQLEWNSKVIAGKFAHDVGGFFLFVCLFFVFCFLKLRDLDITIVSRSSIRNTNFKL